MNIGIDIRTLMDKNYSGVSLFTFELVSRLIKTDKNNFYKLFYNSATDLSNRIPDFKADNAGIVKTGWPNKIFNYIMQKCLKWPKIDSLLGVDLFFMPHLNFISLSSRCRKIITVHDLSFLRHPEFFTRRQNFWHRMVNAKKLLNSSDRIIAVSENTKRDIVDLAGIDSGKIEVIYSGINGNYRRISDPVILEKARSRYDLPEKFILYLSTIEPRKNVAGIIRAFQSARQENGGLNDFYLVIAGLHGWKSREALGMIDGSGLNQNVKFIGYAAENDKPALYSLARIFVYPSFYEGFGFPILEALACGCPVITGNATSLPEVAGDKALMVNPYDISEIKSAICSLLLDRNFADKLSVNSKELVDNFNWEKTVARYLDVFTNIK